MRKNYFGSAWWTMALVLALPVAASADQHGAKKDGKPLSHVDWQKMSEQVVSADEILSGDVTNGFNPVGNVRNLILTQDGSKVEYILYEVPYLYSFYGSDDGFVRFANVALERGIGWEMQVRFDDEASGGKEELKITASEADNRLVSRIMDERIEFAGEGSREVEDLLLDRKTGEIKFFVVQMNPDSLFNDEPRVVPADQVILASDGSMTADLALDRIEGMQVYAPEFLK